MHLFISFVNDLEVQLCQGICSQNILSFDVLLAISAGTVHTEKVSLPFMSKTIHLNKGEQIAFKAPPE